MAQHRAGGDVDRIEHLFPARRRDGLAAQHAAAELEFRIAVGLGQVRRHRIAHAPAQVGLPLLGRQAGDHAVELLEQRRIGQRHQVVVDALRLEERIQLQIAVAAVQVLGGDRRVVVERVVDAGQRLRVARQLGLQLDHQRRLGVELVGRGAGQRQDLLHVGAVTAHQRNGVGVGAGVERRVGQAHAALHEVADVAVQCLEVDVRGEVERHRDADLVQRGDRGGDVLGLLDRVDAAQQRRDRPGAVGFHRGFVQAAGPEVAQQLLHVALRRGHRALQQLALLGAGVVGQLPQRRHRADLRYRVRLQPGRVGLVVEIGAGRTDCRCGSRLLAGRVGAGRRQQGCQAEGQCQGKRANVGHVERIHRGLEVGGV